MNRSTVFKMSDDVLREKFKYLSENKHATIVALQPEDHEWFVQNRPLGFVLTRDELDRLVPTFMGLTAMPDRRIKAGEVKVFTDEEYAEWRDEAWGAIEDVPYDSEAY